MEHGQATRTQTLKTTDFPSPSSHQPSIGPQLGVGACLAPIYKKHILNIKYVILINILNTLYIFLVTSGCCPDLPVPVSWTALWCSVFGCHPGYPPFTPSFHRDADSPDSKSACFCVLSHLAA